MTEQAHTDDGDVSTGPIVDLVEFEGLVAVLHDPRAATDDVDDRAGARAFTVTLRDEDDADLFSTTYTMGPEGEPEAEMALWNLARDALSAHDAAAPPGEEAYDFRNEETVHALDEFGAMFGYEGRTGEAIKAYIACCETRDAFEAVGIDPGHVAAELER